MQKPPFLRFSLRISYSRIFSTKCFFLVGILNYLWTSPLPMIRISILHYLLDLCRRLREATPTSQNASQLSLGPKNLIFGLHLHAGDRVYFKNVLLVCRLVHHLGLHAHRYTYGMHKLVSIFMNYMSNMAYIASPYSWILRQIWHI